MPTFSGRSVALLAALLALAAPARASGDEETLDAVHHTSDGFYLDFAPFGSLELPRIFVVRTADGRTRLDAFATSSAAVASGRYRMIAEEGHGGDHEEAEDGAPGEPDHAEGSARERSAADAGDVVEGDEAPLTVNPAAGPDLELVAGAAPYDATLVPTAGGEVVADLSVTRHLVFIFLGIALVLALFLPLAGKYRRGIGRTSAPRGRLQNALEAVVIYVRDEIARPNLGSKADRFLPYLLSTFFFILACNLLGLVPWGAAAMANITVTAVLAVFTFLVTQAAGTKDYWRHIFWPPGIPWYVNLILVPIEILGLFTKPFALAVRLFANMVAGHLVILNLIGLIFIVGAGFGAAAGYGTAVPAVLLTLFIYTLELLVAFIQAYVFTTLSALFIGMASAEHEHDHDHAEDHGLTAHDVAVSRSNGQPDHKLHERTVGTEAALAPA